MSCNRIFVGANAGKPVPFGPFEGIRRSIAMSYTYDKYAYLVDALNRNYVDPLLGAMRF
jgi:hypothetical protein